MLPSLDRNITTSARSIDTAKILTTTLEYLPAKMDQTIPARNEGTTGRLDTGGYSATVDCDLGPGSSSCSGSDYSVNRRLLSRPSIPRSVSCVCMGEDPILSTQEIAN